MIVVLRENNELFLVEGKSAKNNAKQACNSQTQALYCLGGKPINGFKCSRTAFYKDPTITDLVYILGITDKDTSLDNLNFPTIVILSDADAHGYHIAVLIIGNLYKINPLLLTSGCVYLGSPPYTW